MRRHFYEQPIAMHAPLTSSPTVLRREKNRRALRPLSIAVVAAVLIMQEPNAHAQHKSGAAEPTEQQKAKAQEKRALKNTDEAYNPRNQNSDVTKSRSLGRFARPSK